MRISDWSSDVCSSDLRHPDDVSVQDITRLADVGSGSFYNHFVSKPAVYDSVVDELVEGWVVWIRRATGETSDPALRLSHRLRGSIERSRRDPDFARFVAPNGLFLVERQDRGGASLYYDIAQSEEVRAGNEGVDKVKT